MAIAKIRTGRTGPRRWGLLPTYRRMGRPPVIDRYNGVNLTNPDTVRRVVHRPETGPESHAYWACRCLLSLATCVSAAIPRADPGCGTRSVPGRSQDVVTAV